MKGSASLKKITVFWHEKTSGRDAILSIQDAPGINTKHSSVSKNILISKINFQKIQTEELQHI